MPLNDSLKAVSRHFIPVALFTALMLIYFNPVFEGKTLVQTDVIQIRGTNHEVQEYSDKGEEVLWTNSSFGGMPVFNSSAKNLYYHIHRFINAIFPTSVLLTVLGFIGFYILLQTLGAGMWLSFAGAAGYVLSTFNFLSIQAGHINKVYDIMLMAPVLAGVILVYNGKTWKGLLTLLIFLGMQIFYGHIQVNYYLLFMIFGLVIVYVVKSYKEKTLKSFIYRSLILLGVAVLTMGANIVKIWSTYELAPSTTRGGSELTGKGKSSTGLDYNYAFDWSNGVSETFTLLVPYFKGGGSQEDLGTNSKTYEALVNNGIPRQQAARYAEHMPLYWGDQPFTGGPIYFGAAICFLFLLGMIILKTPLKWWALVLAILSIALSWGKNFPLLTNFFFYHFPLYNKFRSVTMILSISQLIFPLIGILAINEIIFRKNEMKTPLIKHLYTSAGILLGLTLIFFVMGGSLFRFSSPQDSQFPEWLINSLRDDRISKLRTDSLRSFMIILVAAGLIWLYLTDRLKEGRMILFLSIIIIIDLWTVNKRYLKDSDFQNKRRIEQQAFSMTPADKQILKDTTKYYRVLNLATDTFNDGVTSYYHFSVGGYSAIKLERYQELIENHISKHNIRVLDMLNTKYIIIPQKTGEQVQYNPGALGNCWFVKNAQIVANADEENEALNHFDPATTALVDKRFEQYLQPISYDSTASISLTSYDPMKMQYRSKASGEELAVFSDIYYQPGWHSYIDGKEVPHFRADYVLRAMMVPAGEHSIVFEFRPNSYFIGEKVAAAASSIILIILLLDIYIIAWKKKE